MPKPDPKLLRLLLDDIQEAIDGVLQWADRPFAEGYLANALEYQSKLKALVELLEVYDCGSVGGFGYKQPEDLDLEGRAAWLLRKYRGR